MPQFQVFRHFPVHLSIGPFITELVRYIDEQVYPDRFKFKMIGPADKTIQRIEEEKSNSRELQKAPLPSLVVVPVIDEPVANWYKLYDSRRIAPRLGSVLSKGLIYTDDYRISYMTRRMSGHVDMYIVTKSYMETHDIMMAFYDQLYGLNRWVELPQINMYFVIPEDLYFYTEDGGRIVVDWDDTRISKQLIRSINKKQYIYPIKHTPYIRLTSLSDASNFYGGPDTVPVYGLSGTIEFELELPSYLTIETDYLVKSISTTIGLGSSYFSDNVYDYLNSETIIREDKIYYPEKRYYESFDSLQEPGYIMHLPYQYVENSYEYIFFTSKGELYPDLNYTYVSNGNAVKFNIAFYPGEILEFMYCSVVAK